MTTILAGALAGALGALVGSGLAKTLKVDSRLANALTTVCVVGFILVANATHVGKRLARLVSPPSPIDEFGEQLLELPGLKSRVAGKSPVEVQAITQALSKAGMVRISDELLITRARVVAELLAKVDEDRCARFAVGTMAGDDFIALLEALPKPSQASWIRLSRAAIDAELAEAIAPPAPSEEAAAAAFSAVAQPLSGPDKLRLGTNLQSELGSLPPADVCWTVRTLYAGIIGVASPHQAVLARLVVLP
jgi:hypothetical protein